MFHSGAKNVGSSNSAPTRISTRPRKSIGVSKNDVARVISFCMFSLILSASTRRGTVCDLVEGHAPSLLRTFCTYFETRFFELLFADATPTLPFTSRYPCIS